MLVLGSIIELVVLIFAFLMSAYHIYGLIFIVIGALCSAVKDLKNIFGKK